MILKFIAVYFPFSYLAKTVRLSPKFIQIIFSWFNIIEVQVEPLNVQSIFEFSATFWFNELKLDIIFLSEVSAKKLGKHLDI